MARKILLADDSVTAQNMGRKILVDAGYEVLTVNNGAAALTRIAEIKPDLVILDVYMPGYSGLEVCQRLKDSPVTARIPVLLTVGKLEPFKADEARRVHADSHIVKPFEASELLKALARLEDRIVPRPEPAFSTPESGPERFGEGTPAPAPANSDPQGWKSRLPSSVKKQKREPEVAPDEAVASFRDFRAGNARPEATARTKAATKTVDEPVSISTSPDLASADQSPVASAQYVGPEELDALSAVAAKLDPAPTPEVSLETSLPESVTANEVASSVSTESAPSEASAAPGKELIELQSPFPVNVVSFAEPEAPIDRQDEPFFAVVPPGGKSQSQPAEKIELQPIEKFETPSAEKLDLQPLLETTPHSFAAEQASAGKAAAPIDREDEPFFAVAPAEERSQAPVEEAEEQAEKEAEKEIETAIVDYSTAAQAVPASFADVPPPSVVSEPQLATDQELAEALRLLTPAAGSHWVAQPLTLTAEEAALSLEAEMFAALAAPVAAPPESAPPATSMSEIAAAVESRLAVSAEALKAKAAAAVAAPAAEAAAAAEAPAPISEGTAPLATIEAAAATKESVAESAPVEAAAASAESLVHAAAAEAATAPAPPENSSSSMPDADTIASIVDSVLADLRPKLAEEIAKKLSRK